MKRISLALLVVGFVAVAPVAEGRKMAPPPDGLTLAATLTPESGFIDDPFAVSEDGKLLAYVETDASTFAKLHIRDVAAGKDLTVVDISKFTTTPVMVAFIDEVRYLVASRPTPGAKTTAAVFDAKGKLVRRFGPADDIRLTRRNRRPAIVTFETGTKTAKKKGPLTTHRITAYGALDGKRMGRPRTITIDETGRSDELGFDLKYWRDDYLTAVGIRDGQYDPKIDQRRPDTEAWYDVVDGKFAREIVVNDVIEHRRTLSILEAHSGQSYYPLVARDRSTILVAADGALRPITLIGAKLYHYDLDSLSHQVLDDGSLLFSLTIDPVHPDAADKRRAVPVFIDFFRVQPGARDARRVARLARPDKRKRVWRAHGGTLAVMPKHVGWSRGGPELQLYRY